MQVQVVQLCKAVRVARELEWVRVLVQVVQVVQRPLRLPHLVPL